MPIRTVVPKSLKSLKPTALVTNFSDPYVIQAIQDLLDTLVEKQKEFDREDATKGGGVGLAANQIEYPYLPISEENAAPQPGYYPQNFTPPNIYVISIRPVRAALEQCDVVNPTVYINASFEPINDERHFYKEACMSVVGFTGFTIPRYEQIEITADDTNGQRITVKAKGFIARVHQHEMDHGLGKEYLNSLSFDSAQLYTIRCWLNENQNKVIEHVPVWLIKDKLQCVSSQPDFTALGAWVDNELAENIPKEQRSVRTASDDKEFPEGANAERGKRKTFSSPTADDTLFAKRKVNATAIRRVEAKVPNEDAVQYEEWLKKHVEVDLPSAEHENKKLVIGAVARKLNSIQGGDKTIFVTDIIFSANQDMTIYLLQVLPIYQKQIKEKFGEKVAYRSATHSQGASEADIEPFENLLNQKGSFEFIGEFGEGVEKQTLALTK